MIHIERFQRLGLLLFLILMGTFFSIASPHFLSWENFTNILVQSTVLIVVGAGMTMVIATAGIDLSLEIGPVGFDLAVLSAHVVVNPGSILGVVGGILLFSAL